MAVAFQTGPGAFARRHYGGAGKWPVLFSIDDLADYQSGVITVVLVVSSLALFYSCQKITCEHLQTTADFISVADPVSGGDGYLVDPVAQYQLG